MAEIDSCNCCNGISVETPGEIYNRPGLDAIAYRVGVHATFKESMQARISLSGLPALQHLTTRDNNDFSIAFLDAWSVVADILTFYQERIANESYLRTATERYSVLEMARLIGYELRPGVAASAYLAFTLEESSAPLGPLAGTSNSTNAKEGLTSINVEKGTKVQSIPGPDEAPQIFETIEKIETRPEWNTIRPRLTHPTTDINEDLLVIKGIDNNLKEGDMLLIATLGSYKIKKILKLVVDTDAKTTSVFLRLNTVLPAFQRPKSLAKGDASKFLTKGELSEVFVSELIKQSWFEEDLAMLISANKWLSFELVSSINRALKSQDEATGSVHVFRKRAFVFGYNAPQKLTLSDGIPSFSEWPVSETPGKIFLDSDYEVLEGSYVAIQKAADLKANPPNVYPVINAEVRSRSQYGISTKTTEITFIPETVDTKWWTPVANNFSDIRPVTIYAQSEKLKLAELPISDNVNGDLITLNGYYPGLKIGQALILTGDRYDLKGVSASEVIIIKEIIVEKGFTVIELIEKLDYSYIRSSVNISANVALATNGESTEETMGSGDASLAFQQFTLRQPPLTYISGSSSNGTLSTLEVRVNDILWHEVEHFLDHLPDERIYITRINDDGKTRVIFGDGITGARLPSGQENVKAKYRKGIGLAGMVKANQLSQLLTRPLSVKAAINPLAAQGAADPEQINSARSNAPLSILTLGRIVSLQDYEDFSRSFAGIGKSHATWSWVNEKRQVFITVAGANGEEVKKESILYDNLLKAIRQAGDPKVALILESYIPKFFCIKANIEKDPDYVDKKILENVEQKLREEFSFNNRRFGQPVTYAEVVSVIQRVEGVLAVDIDKLYRADQAENLSYTLQAGTPVSGDAQIVAAELLTLDKRPLEFKIVT